MDQSDWRCSGPIRGLRHLPGEITARSNARFTPRLTKSRLVKRSEQPVQFWLSVIFMLVVAVAFIFNVFHF